MNQSANVNLHNSSTESELISTSMYQDTSLENYFQNSDPQLHVYKAPLLESLERQQGQVNHKTTIGVYNNRMKRSGPQVVN